MFSYAFRRLFWTNSFLLFYLRFLKTIERTLACGDVVLIENLDEKIDPVLDPLLGRNTIKKGK